jgi:hypothetical protein
MKIFRTFLLLATFATPLLAAPGLAPQPADTIATILGRQVGQKVELRLDSGTTLAGKVESVGESVVYLSNIVGMELYEAVVVLDDVTAVVTRAPAK